MVWAFGLAATQAAGIREMFGSMAKSFQPGRAAQNGYTAALLGQADFTAGERALEGPRGFAAVTAAQYDLGKVTAGLGRDFELRDNAYKPYACGLVVHPTIDGCSQLHREFHPAPDSIAGVRLRVAPLVLDLCNKSNLTRALESKYSIYHAAAIGLVRGKGGLQEFTDEAVADPALQRVRAVTTAVGDDTITEDQVHIEVVLRNGETLSKFVEQSLGNVHRPLEQRAAHREVRRSSRARVAAPPGRRRRRAVLAHRLASRRRRPRARDDAARRPARCVPAARRTSAMRAALRIAGLALLAAAFVLGAGCGGQSGSSAEVRIPLGAGGVGFLPLLVMRERGLIEKHARAAGLTELTVRWIELGGPAVMNDALLSGSVDFIAAGPAGVHHALGPHARLGRRARRRRDVVAADVLEYDPSVAAIDRRSDGDGQDRRHGRQGLDPVDQHADVCGASATARPKRSASIATP